MSEEQWQRARLIPVVGNSSGREREQRATSALLAVLSIVRPLSTEVLTPLGATRASKATVDCYIEPSFKDRVTGNFRPDGLIRVRYGSQPPWTALVEVKTGNQTLEAAQVNAYIEIARRENFDHVITISNEIAPSIGAHPTKGLAVRSNSRVKVSHFSWTRIAAISSRVRDTTGIGDLEQEWILSELLRYLEHQNSGAVEFDDMGPFWTEIRDAARAGTLTSRTEGLDDIALRWDQLVTYAALKLSIRINEDAEEVLSRAHKSDPTLRMKDFMRELCEDGSLSGAIRVPRTAGDIEIHADLRARQMSLAVEVSAPTDKKARGSLSWLARQLESAPADTQIECYPKGASRAVTTTLEQALADITVVAPSLPSDIARFRVVRRRDLGMNRRGGKSAGFVDSTLNQLFSFYDSTVQHVTPYQAPAPRVSASTSEASERELGSADD